MTNRGIFTSALVALSLGGIVAGGLLLPQAISPAQAQQRNFIVPSAHPFPRYNQLNAGNRNVYPDTEWANIVYKGVPRRKETCLAVVMLMIEHARGNRHYRVGREIPWSDTVGVSQPISGVGGGDSNNRFNGAKVVAQLNSGNPVILQTNDIDPQHFILAVGVDVAGRIIAHDPLGDDASAIQGRLVKVDPATGVVTGGTLDYTIHNYRLVDFAKGAAASPKTAAVPAARSPAPSPAPSPAASPAVRAPQVPATPDAVGPGGTREPGPEQSGTRVTLQWRAVEGATDYDLGVRDLASNRLVFDRRVNGTSQRVTLDPGRRYRWNVAACNAAGCSRFTAPLYFAMGNASTQSRGGSSGSGAPASGAVAIPAVPRGLSPGRSSEPGPQMKIDTVTLQWAEVPGASHYELRIRDIAARRTSAVGPLRQRFHLYRMTRGASYRWEVKACNSAGCSDWSQRQYFTAPR